MTIAVDLGRKATKPTTTTKIMEIDYEIISMAILLLQEGLLSVTSESMGTKVLVNLLVKPAQENVWLGEHDQGF